MPRADDGTPEWERLASPQSGDFPWTWVWAALGGAALAGTLVTAAVWGGTPVAHSSAIDTGIRVAAAALAVLATFVTVHRLRLGQAQQRLREAEQRQREIEHYHRIKADDDARQDAADRRVTELLANAGNLLASENATTRITGLITLQRLGQENPTYRQTVVDVMCAYLQMPFDPPPIKPRITVFASGPAIEDPDSGNGQGGGGPATTGPGSGARQELRVRLTAQRILADRLRIVAVPGTSPDSFWPDIRLNLSGATLIDFRLSRCRLAGADFTDALFVGLTNFGSTEFTAVAQFTGARFTGPAAFSEVIFGRDAFLDAVTFTAYAGACAATFAKTRFNSGAWFTDSEFHGLADFDNVTFRGHTTLAAATFHDRVSLYGAYAADDRLDLPSGWRTEAHRRGPCHLFAVVPA